MRDKDMLVETLEAGIDLCSKFNGHLNNGSGDVKMSHHIKNLKVIKEYLDTHKCEINDFIAADKRDRG